MGSNMQPNLDEKNFIHEGYSQNPFPAWLWFCLITVFVCLVWGGKSWYQGEMQHQYAVSPFLQVKNRDFSLFLWQHPELMRVNAVDKTAYLPGFQYQNTLGMFPDMAEDYVVAPPEVIFQYHTWQRLIGDVYFNRPILADEFRKFIDNNKEWTPTFWPNAPEFYPTLLKDLPTMDPKTALQNLPENQLPKIVKQAFQGWKNFYLEGEQINKVKMTYAQLQTFLSEQPNYARNYWRNIVMKEYPGYLETYTLGQFDANGTVPEKELAPFLKLAYYNYSHQKESVGAGEGSGSGEDKLQKSS